MSATVARVLLAPGRFDAPGAAVRSALVKYAERADVVYGSELAVDLRAEAFRLPGFTQSRGTGHRGRRECAVLTRDEAFQVLDVQTPELTAGGGKGRFTNPLCATTVTLRDLVSGATQVHSYCHLPAHEERGVHGVFAKGTFRTSPLLYMRAARAWAVHLAEIRAGVKPDLLVAAADWNLNGRRRWARSLLRRIFKAAGLSTPVFPPRGTHGSRAIDGLLTDGDVESPAEVVPSGRASDHEWVLTTLTADLGGDMPTYLPFADHTIQWYGHLWAASPIDPNVDLIHTTETTGWPGYENGAKAPHTTARPDIANQRMQWRQHFDEHKSARALRNEDGGVQTNTLNVRQLELVGTCDPAHKNTWQSGGQTLHAGVDYIYWPEAPDWALRALGRYLADGRIRHGIKLVSLEFLPYPESYGPSRVRLSAPEWVDFYGICGHQHAPENDHGDPGAIDIGRALAFARDFLPPPKENPKDQRIADLIDKALGHGRSLKKVLNDLEEETATTKRPRPKIAAYHKEVAQAVDELQAWLKEFRDDSNPLVKP